MALVKTGAILALAIAAAACGQGNSDNVMSPEANALEPADVNAALGPEDTNTSAIPELEANEINTVTVPVDNGGDEPATNNSSE